MGLAILAILLIVRIWDPIPVKVLRLQVFDYFQKIQPRLPTHNQVVIIDLDEKSLATYGQWPWPRTMIAQLITHLSRAHVKAIGFDIIFAEPDRLSPTEFVKTLDGLNPRTREQLLNLPDNDRVLAEAIRQQPIVVSQAALPTANPANHTLPPRTPTLMEIGPDPKPHLFSYPGLLRNIPAIETAAAGHGVITLNPEPDGVVRRVPMLLRVGPNILPTLSLELIRVATQESTLSVNTDFAGIQHVAVGQVHIPTDDTGRMWIHFAKRNPERYISAMDILTDSIPPEQLSGQLVLIGSSAAGLGDDKVTPIEGTLPGVEIHAQILDMLLTQSFLTRSNIALAQELIMILILGLFIIFLVPFFGALHTLLLGTCITIGMVAASWYWHAAHGVLIDVSYGAVGILGLYSLLSYLNYVREEFSRRQIRNTFSRYVSPALVEQLSHNSGQVHLGGETKTMTVLFCDVRDFTSISEQYQADPQGLTQLINQLLTPLTKAILSHHGTIDKYLGDGIMAFWNAPLDDPHHAVHACNAALDILHQVEIFNQTRINEATPVGQTFPPIKIGIGINTGPCVVGNVGSEQRFDYSVLGDTVNIASRLEGLSKTYDLGIVIGPDTAELVHTRLAILEIDLLTLKGKKEAARTFTVIGDDLLHMDPRFQALMQLHADMLEAFRSRAWNRVHRILQDLEHNPHMPLPLHTLYSECLLHYQTHPPPKDWTGTFISRLT
ncbi:MAG: guanylate cyclase [Nitrospirales bacterium]|nr:MAG: guanylate cyclase [Nitrospirales bacterium]